MEHLNHILKEADELIAAKYIKGKIQHGGDLTDMSADQLVDEAINEAVDQLVYLITLKDKLRGDDEPSINL